MLEKKQQSRLVAAECPRCLRRISVPANSEPGQMLTCGECGATLEVASIDPIVLERIDDD